MECKKHPTDMNGTAGVCATCLQERLLQLIHKQERADESFDVAAVQSRSSEGCRIRDVELAFPRSVSPYAARCKSENRHRLFYSTPQVGSMFTEAPNFPEPKKHGKLSLFRNMFKSGSRSDKADSPSDFSKSDPRDSPPCGSCQARSSSHSSPSWLSFLSSRRRKPSLTGDANAHASRTSNQGVSPYAGVELDDYFDDGFSTEALQRGRLSTSVIAVTPASVRRRRAGLTRSKSAFAFCLSPLVRANPSGQWNQKASRQPEFGVSGESRAPGKSYLSTASAPSCGSRSRKLADIGRINYNP
ncbi:hypothetical protein SAY87_014625 [Trapa incisa]|uniref:Uncharacterized protein n=1 Tax=Trapa incisa TaxID=236973 RepID=A0AAN7GSX7_9MYRT|nr:hypothetical protein SAY87_014625 [Trapa incisa]